MQGIRQISVLRLRHIFLVLFFCPLFFHGIFAKAQQNFYDTDLLPSSFHKERREALRAKLPEKSYAVLFSNPVRNRSNNVDYQYSQDPDFYYLSGLNEPHSALIIFKEPFKITGRMVSELIFVQDRNPLQESWNGKRLGIEGVVSMLGFNAVYLNTELASLLPDPTLFEKVLVKFPVDIKQKGKDNGTLNSMVETITDKLKSENKEPESGMLLKAMASLREIKLKPELDLMQKAINITLDGLAEAIRAAKPGMTEYQAQAITEFYFKYKGSEYPGYGSISGSGINACVLHYVTNRKKLEDGDMLLMDMGAEYHGYTADVTRTVPVNGKFTEQQKIIYELVLKAQLAGIVKAIPGNEFHGPHKAATEVIAQGLVDLKIISSTDQVKKYFTHGTSHYLGLAVHDAGNFGPLEPGMVITVEPGIYIPDGSPCDKKWWNIGVRIEDDILITDNQPVVMSEGLTKTITGIEQLMQEKSLFETVK